jgi:hypothetical protein
VELTFIESTLALRTMNNDNRDLKGAKSNKTFAFIHVDDSNPERRKKNRSIAHSHVKKTDRRTKREQQIQSKRPAKKSVVVVEEEISKDGLERLWSDHARSLRASSVDSLISQRSSFSGEELLTGFDDTSGWTSKLSRMSPTIDLGFSTALTGCFGTQDPRTRLILDHCRNSMFSTASRTNIY